MQPIRRLLAAACCAATVLACLLLLSSCEDDDDTSPTVVPAATTAASSATTVPEALTPTSPPASPTPPPATPTPPPPQPDLATVAPSAVEGLETRSDSVLDDPYRYFATHPELPAYPLLGETLEAAIAAEKAAFEAVRGPFDPVPPGATGPSFNVSFDILAASGDVLGVHLLYYEFFGANGTERSTTFWFDLAADRAVPPAALLDGDAGLDALAQELKAVLQARYGDQLFPDLLDAFFADPAQNLDAMGFTADGDLVVLLDEYSIGPGALGRIAVSLPAETVAPYLSDFGRRAREETVRPSGPLRLPAPTPTPVPPTPVPTTAVVVPPAPPGTLDCSVVACIALTFDDGPGASTAALLDILAAANVPATFFVVGVNAQYQTGLLRRMAAEGHEIANHTYDHRDLTTLSPEQMAAEWTSTSDIVAAATGLTPVLFRPPYGAVNDAVRGAIGAPFILWSVDSRDWADRDAAIVTSRVLDSARPGDIVLLHDIHVTSVNAVPAIIDGLRARGFTFVTVSTLLAGSLAPGRTYTRR